MSSSDDTTNNEIGTQTELNLSHFQRNNRDFIERINNEVNDINSMNSINMRNLERINSQLQQLNDITDQLMNQIEVENSNQNRWWNLFRFFRRN